jgi:DNA polymerase-3 subunit epsilon
MVLDRALDPYRRGRRTLTAIAAAYGIPIKGAHQAQGDCLASLRLARAIVAKYPGVAGMSLADLQPVQARMQRAWARNFTLFRRQDDPMFTCSGDWPLIPFTDRPSIVAA